MSDSPYIPIGVDVDEQSFQDLNRNVDVADANLGNLVDTSNSIGQSADDAGNRLQNAFAKMRANIDDNINSMQALRLEVQGLGDDTTNLNNNSGGGGDGGEDGGGGGLGNISGLRRSGAIVNRFAPGVGAPLQIAGMAQQLTKTFESLGVDMGSLTAAAGIAAPAVIGITLAVTAFNAELKAGHDAVNEALTQFDDYYKTIAKDTTEQAQQDLDNRTKQQAFLNEQRDKLQGDYENLQKGPGDVLGDLSTDFSNLFGAGKDLANSLDKAKKAATDNQAAIDADNVALGNGSLAANNAAAAEKELQKIRDANADKVVSQARQDAQLIASGTSKGVEAQIADIEAAKKAISGIDLSKLSTPEHNKLTQEWTDLNKQEIDLTNNVLPLIEAREKETAEIERASKAVTDHADAIDKRNQAEVNAVDKYNAAVQTAEDNSAQARINANQKLQDALVSATEKAKEAISQAEDQLQQKLDDLHTTYDRSTSQEDRKAADQRLDDQIKTHRQEASDLQTHLDNLKQIRDADAGRQRDDLLNRNFRDLFALSEQKTQDMNKENDRYSKQEDQRQQALQNQEDDQARAEAVQRRERQIAYQQQQDDARKNYQRALEQADDAHTKAIQVAEQGYQKELRNLAQNLIDKEALLKQDAINQLKLLQQTEDVKAQIFQNSLDQANQMLGQSNAQVTNSASRSGRSVPVPFAGGGYANAGDITLVNDGNSRESFNNSQFPAGLGIFIPAQSGYINPGGTTGKGQSMNNTFYIQSTDAQGVRREVLSVMKELTQ